ncbi:MAG: DNA repair protein RadA [bacterium]
MPKTETLFVCQSCGQDFPKWAGQCASCGEWNTLVEEHPTSNLQHRNNTQFSNFPISNSPISITAVDYNVEDREQTGIAEVDRVLGGGVVAGSVVLVSGEPGIGKSTMMLQVAEALSQKATILYVSGEESAKQIRLRAERLGTLSKKLMLLPETNIFAVEAAIAKVKPAFVVIDSIQTMFRDDITSAPGSVSQVRECASYLVRLAKATHVPIFIVGHVTKEGNIAGPRILEHMVDTVLYFEGERHKQYRILRANKNRFGSTNEVGIFEMKDKGLVEVPNPSEVFLSERPKDSAGSVVTAAIEGTRPMLIEIQALTSFTKNPYPSRKSTGVDYNRVAMIIAVLEKQLGLNLSTQDIYVNAAGGVRAFGPAMDLAIALAITSSFKNKPIDAQTAVVGEIGLAGEIRSVSQIDQRIKETGKLGFKRILVPKMKAPKAKMEIVTVASLREAAQIL